MRKTLTTIALFGLTASVVHGQHGQGPVAKGPIRVDGLDLGTYWFGAEIDLEALRGKVVLVEIWGS